MQQDFSAITSWKAVKAIVASLPEVGNGYREDINEVLEESRM